MDLPIEQVAIAHSARLRTIAYRILGDATEAEDAAQDALLALHKSGGLAIERVGSWLDRVVTHSSIDRLRKRRPSTNADLAEPRSDGSVLELASEAEERERLSAAIEELPARQRLVIRMRLVRELPFAAISTTLGITEGAAKTHFQRAVRSLTRRMRNTENRDETM